MVNIGKEIRMEIVNEILNDAFWLGYITELKRKIDNATKKEILASFLIFFSSIFGEETIKANYGGLTGKRNVTLKDIKDLRNYNLKHCPSSTSNITNDLIQEMEIDFDNYVFDIMLCLNNNDLLDINFRTWEFNKGKNFETLDGLVLTPEKWIEVLIPNLNESVHKIIKEISDKYVQRINNANIKEMPYASHKFFNANLNKEDKLYILQRYGLIKTTMFIDDIMKEKISFDISKFHFDFQLFMIKSKAIIIEMFWNDFKNNKNIKVIQQVLKRNKECIDNKFYHINRKIRNNLHYSDYNRLTEEELKILIENQDLYLNNVIDVFDENIIYKFDSSYKISLFVAKLRYMLEH